MTSNEAPRWIAYAMLGISVLAMVFTAINMYFVKVNTDLALSQTQATWRTARADFMLRLYKDILAESPNAEISEAVAKKKPILEANGGFASDYELDMYLGYIELLYDFLQLEVLNKQTICTSFDIFVTRAWEHQDIKTYVFKARERFPRAYEEVERLAGIMETCSAVEGSLREVALSQ